MNAYRTLTTLGGLFLTACLALAQYPPAAPPTPPAMPAMPAPRAMPMPAPTPWPAAAPMAAQMVQDVLDRVTPLPAIAPMAVDIEAQMDQVRSQMAALGKMDFDMAFQFDATAAQLKATEKFAEAQEQFAMASSKIPMAMQMARTLTGPRGSDDSLYQNGLSAIDNHQYDQALSEFNNVVSHAGARAEGALYWKAYVLNKLGRSADAQAAIDTLRKTYPSSRWLDDSKALELEVKQSKGPVSPDSETDEDLKVLALNGLMQSDPEKALPQIENMMKGSHSPKLKRQMVYVLAQSNTPKAQQLLEQVARGGNPDLQVRAIQYLAQKRNPNTAQILLEIYTSSSDPAVKRTILDNLSNTRDKDNLMQILRVEKDGTLRNNAIGRLGDVDGQPELWQIYQSETTPEGKISVLSAMLRNGNLDKLTEVARTDKEPKVRQKAIQVIASQQSGTPSATLATLYSSEQDEKVKQTIIDNLSNSRNCKPLVDVARAEKDLKLKLRLVERLSNMTKSCPAATDYLTELLSK